MPVKTIVESILGSSPQPAQVVEQQNINTGEIFHIWHTLIMRYQVLELHRIMANFVNDADFKIILSAGQDEMQKQIKRLEDELVRIGIPLPVRPPRTSVSSANTEVFRDEFVFNTVLMGVQNFISELPRAALAMLTPRFRNLFAQMITKEVDYYSNMSDYGKLKGWMSMPPEYHPGG